MSVKCGLTMSRIKGKFAKSYDRFIKRESLLPPGLLKLIESYKPRKIVEFGCGTGSVAIGLGLEGFDVTGVDISGDMLKEARQKSGRLEVDIQFRRGDIVCINLKSKFDLLLCLGNTLPLIYRLNEARKLFRNFSRHLNPGGAIIIQQLNYDKILKEKPHTIAVDHIENLIRIKQYKYVRNLVDFVVTIVDHSHIPPKIDRSRSRIRPWKTNELISELRKVRFYNLIAFSDYSGSRFGRQSRDLILTAKMKPAG